MNYFGAQFRVILISLFLLLPNHVLLLTKRVLATTLMGLDWFWRVGHRSSCWHLNLLWNLLLLRSNVMDYVNMVVRELVVKAFVINLWRLSLKMGLFIGDFLRRRHVRKRSYWQWANWRRLQDRWWKQKWGLRQNSWLNLLHRFSNQFLVDLGTFMTNSNIWKQWVIFHRVLPLSNLSSLRTLSLFLHIHRLILFSPLLPVSKLLFDFQLFESELFLLVIKCKIIKKFGWWFEIKENLEHSFANFWKYFLAVSALTSWFVLIKWIFNVNELGVWNILYLNPLNVNRACPLVLLLPNIRMIGAMIYSIKHFGNSAKLLWLIHAEKEVNFGI